MISQLGRTSARLNARGVVGKQHTTRDQPMASSPINDNYCVHRSPGLLAGSQTSTQELFLDSHVNFHVVIPVPTRPRAFPKERIKSRVASLSVSNRFQIKICERCFLCHSIVLCKTCNKCQKCCLKSACRGQTSKLLANLAGSGCWSEGGSNPERGLHPLLSDPAQSHKVCHSPKLAILTGTSPC